MNSRYLGVALLAIGIVGSLILSGVNHFSLVQGAVSMYPTPEHPWIYLALALAFGFGAAAMGTEHLYLFAPLFMLLMIFSLVAMLLISPGAMHARRVIDLSGLSLPRGMVLGITTLLMVARDGARSKDTAPPKYKGQILRLTLLFGIIPLFAALVDRSVSVGIATLLSMTCGLLFSKVRPRVKGAAIAAGFLIPASLIALRLWTSPHVFERVIYAVHEGWGHSAVIAGTEIGPAGLTALVVMGILIVAGAGLIAWGTKPPFSRSLAAGVTAWFAVSALIGFGPLVNQALAGAPPLPFSMFGPWLVPQFVLAGVLFSCSRYNRAASVTFV